MHRPFSIVFVLAAIVACSSTESNRADGTATRELENNKEVVRHFLALVDRHELDKLDDVLAPGFQIHFGASTFDRKQVEPVVNAFLSGFPDLKHDVQEVLAIQDRVVLRAIDRGTHTGEFQGVKPTGRQVTVGQIGIYRMVGGKIAEIWEEFDSAGLMQQID